MRFCVVLLFTIIGIMAYAQEYTDSCGHRVLFIGDSITDGDWGKSDGKPSDQRPQWDWNHIFGHGYVEMCATYYMAYKPKKKLQFFNRGISGNCLTDLESRWQHDCIEIRPEVISILIGTNDIARWLRQEPGKPFDFDGWKVRLENLLAYTQEQLPGVRVVLCTPFVANAGSVAQNYSVQHGNVARLAQVVNEVCKEKHLTCVSFDKLLERLPKKYPEFPIEYWSWDGIHPTPAMHRFMADEWIKAVKL